MSSRSLRLFRISGTMFHSMRIPHTTDAEENVIWMRTQVTAAAIFISCTNFGTLDIIESLEKKLGKPVVTSNSASMWKMMRILSITKPGDSPVSLDAPLAPRERGWG